jgi:glycosyltransferase involved in cell wall biosynthesis
MKSDSCAGCLPSDKQKIMRVLYDGWTLVHSPLSPEALQLWAILTHLPEEVTPVISFPQVVPEWIVNLEAHLIPFPDTPFGRLRWEQLHLPRLAKEAKVDNLHLTTPTTPVLGNLDTILSPAAYGAAYGMNSGSPETHHVLDRLRRSLAHGGMVRVKEILWPVDLPAPQIPGQLGWLSPILPPGFDLEKGSKSDDRSPSVDDVLEDLDFPYEFIIYHGPGDEQSLDQLLQAWTWAASSIGDSHPLLLLGLNTSAIAKLSALEVEYDVGGSLKAITDVSPDLLPDLYRRCSAVFHPAPASPWSGPVRLALASGKPLVASENSIADAISGPAAYLAPSEDPRALGAALVTVIVEDQIAERLSAAARRRAANWEMDKFSAQLWGIYNQVFAE